MYKHLDVDDLVLEEFKAGRTEIDAFVSVFTKLKMALYGKLDFECFRYETYLLFSLKKYTNL